MKRNNFGFSFSLMLTALALLALANSCVKGERKPSAEPDTKISIGEINLSGENRLNTSVKLSWFGTDEDGYVVGYEISVDNQNWTFTTAQDSTILFEIPTGQDTVDAQFYVRAVDNDGLKDLSPAHLNVPLKNTAPQARFNKSLGPKDTAFAAATFRFDVSDPEGDSTISKVEIRFNNGGWYELRKGENLVSILAEANTQAMSNLGQVFYGFNASAEALPIDGINPNGINYLLLRATDISGAESKTDTADAFYFKMKSPGVDLLWISGHIQSLTQHYKARLANISVNYDLLNYGSDLPSDRLPNYWNPTIRLVASLYSKIFFTSAKVTRTNPVTSKTNTLLNFAAAVIQDFSNQGGKILVSTSFGIDEDVSSLVGPLPISGLETKQIGQARIFQDSSLVPLFAGPYPEIHSEGTFTQIVPIVKSSDGENFYRAELNNGLGPWNNSDIVGVARRPNNQLKQVLFGVQLHWFDPQEVEMLLQQILVNEF